MEETERKIATYLTEQTKSWRVEYNRFFTHNGPQVIHLRLVAVVETEQPLITCQQSNGKQVGSQSSKTKIFKGSSELSVALPKT